MAFGVSNSFKRGTVKTYTRQRACIESMYEADCRPRKEIRMDASGHVVEQAMDHGSLKADKPTPETTQNEVAGSKQPGPSKERASSTTAPSSPPAAERTVLSPDAVSSDSELSSLPSSPPRLPSPILTSRKPAFTFLKRKRSTADDDQNSRPLSNITANARNAPRPTKKAMTQMQIDLGGDVRKTCRACGMEYIPSVKEDAALHRKFCGMNVGGIEVGKPFLKDESVKRIRSKVLSGEKEAIMVIDQKSSVAARNKAKKVLDVVNAELNAADLDDDVLWGQADGETGETHTSAKRKGVVVTERRAGRFKVFLHLISDKCVGFCLAEKVSHAFPVVSAKIRRQHGAVVAQTKSSSLLHSTSADIVLLGVSRIWTSKSYRGQGLAINLLESARSNFFFGVEVPKHLVAFSQPTESGGRLAERWFEAETGWHVYDGSCW